MQGTLSISSLNVWLKGSLFWTPSSVCRWGTSLEDHLALQTQMERVFTGSLPSLALLGVKAQLTYCA